MNDFEMLELAIGIAVEAHRGQKDRCGAPYILHPLRVMFRLSGVQERVVAILHDVAEDTQVTFEELSKRGFPPHILHAIDCLTKRDGEPYEQFVQRSASDPLARKVKLADLEDNMDVRRNQDIGDKERDRFKKYLKAWRELKPSGSFCP